MLSWYSKGARLASAATALLFFLVWTPRYWDIQFDPQTLRRPWSIPWPEHKAHEKTVDFPPLSQPGVPPPLRDPFFDKYEGGTSESIETFYQLQPQTILAASPATAAPLSVSSSAPPSMTATPLPSPEINSASQYSNSSYIERATIPLILYAYVEAPDSRANLAFFVAHALHAHAIFVFIFNGDTDAEFLLPINAHALIPSSASPSSRSIPRSSQFFPSNSSLNTNIYFLKRPNTCFDLGAYALVLKSSYRNLSPSSPLHSTHNGFILINASLRGPFIPFWSNSCWSTAYLSKLSSRVKLVGMSINCVSHAPRHVQSMILATDAVGLSILLAPDGIDACPADMGQAVAIETKLTQLVKARGYEVVAMMAESWSLPDHSYIDDCVNGDVTVPLGYEGVNLHPYETMFVKTKRGADVLTLELLTKWHDQSNYTSYDVC